MFLILVFLLVATPLVEIWLLIRVAHAINWGPTFLLVIGTGVVGATLARHQGLAAWMRIQSEMAEGKMPTSAMVDAVLIFAAGLVLLTPGIITDCIGLALLIPPIRAVFKRKAADYFRSRITTIHYDVSTEDDFIDVEAREVNDEKDESRSSLP